MTAEENLRAALRESMRLDPPPTHPATDAMKGTAPMSDHLKHWLDALSLGAVVATLAAWLPPLAALASLVWYGIRIFETRTVQRLLGRTP